MVSSEEELSLLLRFMKWVADEDIKVYRDYTEDVARQFLKMPPKLRKQSAKGYDGPSDVYVAQQLKHNPRI